MQKGVIISPDGSKLILHEDGESNRRPKRSPNDPDPGSHNADGLVVVYESAKVGGECGIKPANVKRMHAPRMEAVLLTDEQKDARDVMDDLGKADAVHFPGDELDDKDVTLTRTKRAIVSSQTSSGPRKSSALSADDKAIEIAVFVDDVLYRLEEDMNRNDPIGAIQELVFTYLNSVSF